MNRIFDTGEGKRYDVKDEYISDFAKNYPEATTIAEVDGKKMRVKAKHYDAFMKEYADMFKEPKQESGYTEDSYVGDMGDMFVGGASKLGGSALGLLDKGTKQLEKIGIPRSGIFGEAARKLNEYGEKRIKEGDRYNGKGFTDLLAEGDILGALGSAGLSATQSAPLSLGILASSALTGGVAPALAAAGAITASDKYDQLENENPNMGEGAKWLNSIATGAAEAATEMLGPGAAGKAVASMLRAGKKEAAAQVLKNGFLDKLAKIESKHWIAAPIASEGGEEMANAFAEYYIDKLSGVQRDDNLLKTMIDAGAAGAMGGGQFVPVIGAGKMYERHQKKQLAKDYESSKAVANELLGDDMGSFTEVVLNHSKSPMDAERFVDSFVNAKGIKGDGVTAVRDYTRNLLSFNGYVETVKAEIDEETSRRIADIDKVSNLGMGKLVSVNRPGYDAPTYITSGNIVFDEEGNVDDKRSDSILYYLDDDGKVQQATPKDFTTLDSEISISDAYAQATATVRNEILSREEAELADMQLMEGDMVQLTDGRQGMIQQMSDDGGYIVNVGDQTIEVTQDDIIGNMSENMPQDEVSPSGGDGNVSEMGQMETMQPQDTPQSDLPLKKDGSYDFDNFTPQQSYEYTAKESPEDALADLDMDISIAKDKLERMNKALEKAVGGKRIAIREEIKGQQAVLDELEAFRASVAPQEEAQPIEEAQPRQAVEGEPRDIMDELLDGGLTPDEVDMYLDNMIADSDNRLSDVEKKAPKMGTDIAGYKRLKKEWQQQRDAIEKERDEWKRKKSEVAEARITPQDEAARNLLQSVIPQNGEELAAHMLGSGSIKLTQDSYKKEVGAGGSEARLLFGLFAGKDKGGVSIERAGEMLMQHDLEMGTNFFDQNDPNAGRDAIIEVLSGSRTRGDLLHYIQNNRERMAARERDAAYNEYAKWSDENYHMTPEEYEAYEEDFRRQAMSVSDEAIEYIDGQTADDMAAEMEDYEEIEAILANKNKNDNESVERDDEGGASFSDERGDSLLQEEQPVQAERAEGVDEGHEKPDSGVRGEDAGAQEGASIIDKIRYSSPVEITGNEISPSEDLREYKKNALEYGRSLRGEYINKDSGKTIFLGKNAIKEVLHHDYKNMEQLQSIAAIPKIIENAIFVTSQENTDSKVNAESFDYYVCGLRIADVDYTVRAVFVKPKDGDRYYDHKLTRIEKGKLIDSLFGTTPGFNQTTSLVSGSEDKKLISILQDKVLEKDAKEAKSFVAPSPKENENPLDYAERIVEAKRLHDEELKVDTNPSEAQKEAGLTVYKKEPVAKKTHGNKLVSEERYEELKKRMRAKLGGQMNMGIDPEILAIGTEMAVYHIEKGLRKFSDYSKAMIDDLGDAIRPYLKSFYNGARDLPEVGDNGWDKDMTTYEDVRSFDVANFDKPVPDIMDVAETVIKETKIAVQASAAEKKIKNSRKKRTDNKDKPLPLYANDLFTPNNIKDNEQGNSRADQGVGRKAREEDRGSERGGDRGSVHGSDVLDTERGRGIPISDSDKRPVVRNQNNFSFPEKGIELPSGDISKLKANIEAIETLKDVEDGQGKPTPEQQAKMSRYVGWGGLSEALNEGKYNARDNNWTKDRNWNDKYLRYYEKLKSLLSKEEFDSAVRSTTTSHYTPSEVVESLWGITEKLGFKGGNISEPAMGIGNIIGMMPRSISENSSISGFEIDSLSGRMAKALYPDANIKVQGYEKTFSPNSKDLVITNVPFGKNAPYDKVLDKQFRKKLGSSYNLHNYFILKGLLELKEGGLGVFVTSSATMDGADSKFREYVSGNGYDLVGAIRLPNDAFQKGAGTSVTADIVIFRKRKYGEPSNGIGFATTTQIGEGTYMEDGEKRSKPIMVNVYFSNHPDMMLGDMMTAYDAGSGGLYSGASQTLKAKPGADLSKELFNAIDNLPKNIVSGVVETKGPEVVGDFTLKDGTITVQNGNVFVVDGESLNQIKANPTFVHNGKTRKIADAVNDYNDIKKNLYDLIHDEQTKGVDPEPARKRLNKVYDAFVSKYGTLNRNKALDDIFAEDVEHGLPFSLETVRRVPSTTGKSMVWEVSKADGILNKRVSYPFELPTKADNVLDAVNISKSYKGNIDIPYISEITGIDEVNVTNEILEKGIAYRDPVTGNIIDKIEYLSGNVKDKLVEAKAALEDHPEFQKNVDDLEAVQPERIPYGEISYRLGTTWIPSEFINNFADNELGISHANAIFIPEIGEYILDKRAFITDYAKAGQFKTERMDAIDVFKAALNQRKPKVYDEIKYYEDGKQKTRRVVNEHETQAVAEKISDMSDKFVEYIDSKTMFHGRIEDVYNDKYNNYVLKKYDKPVFEHYPNADKNITLRDHQSKAVQRCLSESTLLAHQVGTGKTFTMITSAMEMRRLGIAKKPMIVVQNATLEDFVRDFYKLYPSAKILSPTKEERNADNRTRLFNLIATGDFDAIVVPQSFMAFIPDSEERKKAYIQKRIDDFEEAVERIEDKALQERLKREAKSMRDSLEGIKKGKNVKGKAKTAETITAKTERILDRRTDNVMTFEQMGVDALFIDEAHNYKKIGFPSKMSNVKGIDTSASQRANSMLLKAQWISENNGGRNVVLATGTPITNTMAEVWTMMNFVAPDILDAYSINSFDEFATTFGTVEPSLEFTATGNFKIAERFKSYTNVPELIKAFRNHTDVVLTEDVKEFKEDKNIPKLKDNKMTNVIVEKNEDLEDVMQTLIKELEDYNKLTGKEKKDKSALPLVVFSKAKQAAIDLRLLNPTFPDNPDSKTNKVVDNVLRLYKESDKDKGTQLIFCDSYQSPSETPKMDLFDVDLSVPQFNLYNDIKEKLIKGGVPSNQIAIVGNYEGERRNALFDKVRNGDVRILIGSTEKMGVGVNVQDRLFALHHIDAPIRPMDFEQRNGRILRQGNLYATWDKPVNIVTYGVKGTLDATAYDRLRIKQNFINQMMKGDISSRVMEEQDDSDPSGMTFSEMAATLSGDKTAQLLFVAQNKLKKLLNSKRSDLNSKSSMRGSISNSKLRIQGYNSRKDIMERNANIVKENFPDGVESVTFKGNTFSDGISNKLTPIINDYYDRYTLDRNTPPLKISLNGGKGEAIVHFNEGMMVYSLYLGKEKLVENRDFSGGKGLMASIDRQLGIPAKSVSDIAAKIKAEENKIAGLEEAVKKPWGKEDELNAAQAEVNDLQRQLVEKVKAEDIQLESTLDVDGTLVKEEGETRFRFMGVDTTNNRDNVSSIESSINDWSNKLNTPIRVIHAINEINDDNERRQENMRKSKGWYNPDTGECVIVLPNASGIADVQATILHEVVAHKGLRGLLGDRFNDMLDGVYRSLPVDMRRKLAETAITRYAGNVRTATEEYLANIAEKGVKEPLLWNRIRSAIKGFFRSMGINLRISDEDIAYMLWKSRNRLERGDTMVNMIGKIAKDAGMRDRLLFRSPIANNGMMLDPDKGTAASVRTITEGLRGKYGPIARKLYSKLREGWQDRMIALRDFQRAITKATGHEVRDFEDAYTYENTTQSKAAHDLSIFRDTIFKGLVDEVGRLATVNGKLDKAKAREVENYMMIRHGLERNEYMRGRELSAFRDRQVSAIESYIRELEDKLDGKRRSGKYTDKEIERMEKANARLLETRRTEVEEAIDEREIELQGKDYSGLTDITKELFPDKESMDEEALRDWMKEFEKDNSTSALWDSTRKATHAVLDMMHKTNLISSSMRDELKGRYKHYIPLKDWDATTAGEIWDYVDADRDIVSNPVKTAKGRKSRAGNVLANIISDYESATMMGYKNLTKLRFMNLVRNSKTDMASVSGQWYVKGVNEIGEEVWEPVSADGFTEDAEENARIINEFEERMNEMRKLGEAKTQKEVLELGVPIKNWQEKQHVVRVKEGGKDMLVYIKGDPRVAQALNGLNNRNLSSWGIRAMNKVRQFMMLNFTSRNVNFILRNLVRDILYTNTMNFVKYGAGFELKYMKNFGKSLRRIAAVRFMNAKDSDFEAFLKGGGRTGFVDVMGYERYKTEVERMIHRSAGGKLRVKDVFNTLGGYLEAINSVIEDSSRFATYITAKEVGMSELQSVKAAKEVSVNFNRRGSGAMGAAYAQSFYFFFNASIQGTHNFASAVKGHPGRAAAAMAMWATLGFAISSLSAMMFGDDDEYNDIPDYIRQNNLIFPIAKGRYALLPLPVELRALYGMGDMAAQLMRGEYDGRDFSGDMIGKLMEALPMSAEGSLADEPAQAIAKALIPDAVSPFTDTFVFNENFFGKRITGRNGFNKYVPEYHKVTVGTSKALIRASEAINRAGGGDYATKGWMDKALLNPSAVEYLFEQYLGGVGKAITQTYKTAEDVLTGDVNLRNVPVVSGLSYETSDMVPRDHTNERYNILMKEYEEAKSRERMYRKGLREGESLMDAYKDFAGGKGYVAFKTMGAYKKAIDNLYQMAEGLEGEQKKAIFMRAKEVKKQMINEIYRISDEKQ